MAKIMLHHAQARAALARGVAQLTQAVQGTMGPKGTNAIIDRPQGTPMISRDGVSIAAEIDLPCRFENMGAQVVREVSKQTNDLAGDGTTTATVLANALIQDGVALLSGPVNPVDVVTGMERAGAFLAARLRAAARPLKDDNELERVAVVAATEPALGRLVTEALRRVGDAGVIEVEYALPGQPTRLEVEEGLVFDRGFISHHMATDPAGHEAVLEQPRLLLTDHKVTDAAPLLRLLDRLTADGGHPLLLIADEVAPEVVAALMHARRQGRGIAVAANAPEFGHWRKAMLEDIAIMTGGRVVARDLGGRLEDVAPAELGRLDLARITSGTTALVRGHGDPAVVAARRQLVQRLWEEAPPNIERDKLAQRLARLTSGTALLLAGGATPVEQKRTAQLLEDSLNAARAARAEGVLPGGGTALAQLAPSLDLLARELDGDALAGLRLVQNAIRQPLAIIAGNAGQPAADVVRRVVEGPAGTGFDARLGVFVDMVAAGIIDPVKVTCMALENALSVARLILTTHTLVADLPEGGDPTAGPALGGGAEKYGRQ